MPRIRTIKPTHWNDKQLAGISLSAHLLWIASWNFSDDKGIFEGDPLLLKSQIFPRRTDIRIEQISQWLDQLVTARFIIPFDYKGQGYYISRTFETHQRIDKPQPSSIPSDFIEKVFQEYSKNIPGTVTPVLESNGKERKGKETVGETPIGDGEAEASPPDIQSLFLKLEKTKKNICDFIKKHHPDFIEPYVALWNLFAEEKRRAKVSKVSDHRKRKFKVRIAEKSFDFLEILKRAGQSEFLLTGKWFGFDWILENESNYLKIIEGNYDKKALDRPAPVNDQDIDLQYLYETFLEGHLNKKLVKEEHFDLISKNYPLTTGHLSESKKRRIQMLNGSNQAADLRLLDDYQKVETSDLIKKDHEVIVRIAKKLALMEFFQLLKSVNAKTISDGIKHTTTISA